MCQFKSGIAILRGGEIELLTLPRKDSHTKIREYFKIGEDNGLAQGGNNTPVEYVPYGDLTDWYDWTKYKLIYDDCPPNCKPDWVTDEMEARIVRGFQSAIKKQTQNGCLEHGGYIYLSSLKTLPENAKLSAHEVYWQGFWWQLENFIDEISQS